MIPKLRHAYNKAFTQKKYQACLNTINTAYNYKPIFRISETPIFVPNEFRDQLIAACDDIIDVIVRPDFKEFTQGSIQEIQDVPNEDAHPTFLVIDFGVCEAEGGGLIPQMIEMQGFPSLYMFQDLLAEAYAQNFVLPKDRSHLFNNLTRPEYIQLFRDIIVGESNPENVVLLEVEPEKQPTQIDFWATAKELGIKVICLSKVIRRGKKLYYKDATGRSIRIEKIYNRVILDELERNKKFQPGFHFTDDVDVEWIGHPNWFFRISKYTLPFIDSPYVPKTHFLKDLEEIPEDLENYVLKPLFSFSGQGVKINVTKADIDAVEDKTNYILQRKVNYVPVLETPSEPAKIEIRMLFVWKKEWERPMLVNNLIRLSKGEMIGVRYNKDKDWVGASVGLFGHNEE
jgi:hypothetical protein